MQPVFASAKRHSAIFERESLQGTQPTSLEMFYESHSHY
jgi:hypothetical protein